MSRPCSHTVSSVASTRRPSLLPFAGLRGGTTVTVAALSASGGAIRRGSVVFFGVGCAASDGTGPVDRSVDRISINRFFLLLIVRACCVGGGCFATPVSSCRPPLPPHADVVVPRQALGLEVGLG